MNLKKGPCLNRCTDLLSNAISYHWLSWANSSNPFIELGLLEYCRLNFMKSYFVKTILKSFRYISFRYYLSNVCFIKQISLHSLAINLPFSLNIFPNSSSCIQLCLVFFKSTAVQRSSFDFSNNVVYNVAIAKTAQRIKVAQWLEKWLHINW